MNKFISFVVVLVIVLGLNYSASALDEDSGGDFTRARIIQTNEKASDNIADAGDKDYFKFDLKSAGLISVTFNHEIVYDSGEVWIGKIYNEYGEELLSRSFVGNKKSENTCEIGLDKGTYFVAISGSRRVDLWNNVNVYNSCNYSLKINYSKNVNAEKEFNNNFENATKISPFYYNKGSLKDVWDCDFYSFEVKKSGEKYISFEHPLINENGGSEYFEIRLYDETGKEIKYISSLGNIKETKELVELKKGLYYIRIGGGYSYGGHLASQKYTDVTYSLCVYDKIGKVTKVESTASCYAVALKWTPIKNVTGYFVYKYNVKNKKYEKIATINGSSSYKLKNLSEGTVYRFKIIAYKKMAGKTFIGESSSVCVSVTKPNVVGKTTTKQTTSAINLTWSKVKGADGYRIYRYNTKTKTWDKIKTTTATSYKVQNLKAGTTYKFRIKAYKKHGDTTIWGAATSAITVATKPLTPAITAVASTAKNRMAVSWKNVSGESGYQVYASTKKDTGYKKVITAKANVVKGVRTDFVSGRTYYLKVRAYKKTDSGTVYSAWSAVKSVKIK